MKFRNKAILIGTTFLASPFAMATGDPIGDKITAAVSAGQANYTLVVIGVIGLAAISFGLGMIVSSMRK